MVYPEIEQLMKKQGIDSLDQLSSEERKTFDEWQRVLSDGEITVDKIVAFCKAQITLIEAQWAKLDFPLEKNERLIAQHIVYKTLVRAIEAPTTQRESLVKHLQGLIAES